MANTNVNLIGLDFDSFKARLKAWYRNNTQFKDVDFDGSNISQLIEVLAYNDYLQSFYGNMIGSEMFMDSSVLRDSGVSHAKDLNYTPRSFTSASAVIKLDIVPLTPVSTVVMPVGTTFTSKVGGNTFTFSTEDTQVISSANGVTFSSNVTVYEGIPVNETFVINYANTSQRFVLSNPTVDTTTIDVIVYEDSGTTPLTYTPTDHLFNLDSTSKVFFIQAAENQQYEIVFGDNVFGRRPKDGAVFVVNYLAGSGELPNSASVFTADGPIDGWSNITVTTLANASGGAVNETLDSIKFNAPRYFQTQGRASTESDYEVLLKKQFPEIQAISVFGGEDHEPPVYGKVFISVDIVGADGAPQVNKDRYAAFLKDRRPTGITPVFIDPDFMGVAVTTNVKYNVNTTTKLSSDIEALARAAISQYNIDNLQDFKSTMYGSQLMTAISVADSSIISNDTTFRLIRRVNPETGKITSFAVSFGQKLAQATDLNILEGQTHYGGTITSNTFVYKGVRSTLIDDTIGNIWVGSYNGSAISLITKIGTINYTTGFMQINNIIIDSYEDQALKIRARSNSRDLTSTRNTILQIEDRDVSLTVTGIKA